MKIIHFSDLHLGVENWGRIDPVTGLSSRFHDILSTLDEVVGNAIKCHVDLVLFCGDAYKSREPSQTQQKEFARRIARLSEAGISVFLLTGNHDLPNATGRATSTEIFNVLSVKNVHVASRPGVQMVKTTSGPVQIAALPWVRRSALLGRDESKNLTFEQINQKLQEILTSIIQEQASKLDPSIPAILAAHVWVANAITGTESNMTIGQEHALLLSNLRNRAFDYIALGHIHKRQILADNPPVIYSGSLQRLDFGDEADDKGYYVITIDKEDGHRKVSAEFHPVKTRRFLSISINILPSISNPTATILSTLERQADNLQNAIVRLQLSLPQEMETLIDDSAIRSALDRAHNYIITRDIRRESRIRLGGLSVEKLKPIDALKLYLDTINTPSDQAEVLMEYGQRLVSEDQPI